MAEFTPSKEICYYFKSIIIVIIETTQFTIWNYTVPHYWRKGTRLWHILYELYSVIICNQGQIYNPVA
jgi:hypothetical protein